MLFNWSLEILNFMWSPKNLKCGPHSYVDLNIFCCNATEHVRNIAQGFVHGSIPFAIAKFSNGEGFFFM